MNKQEPDSLKFFFCIGSEKSGTSILARVLDQHAEIACLYESYLLEPYHQSCLINPAGTRWEKQGFNQRAIQGWWNQLRKGMYPSRRRRLLNRLVGKRGTPAAVVRRVMTEVFSDFALRTNARIVGDKWPFYIDHLELILEAFPDAKFIYNVRDPRGLWSSGQKFKDRGRGDHVLQGMLKRDAKIQPFLTRSNFLTVRYEDLIASPSETARKLWGFLGAEYKEEYLNYDPARDPYPQRWGWVPETVKPLNPESTEKWRTQMTPEQIARVNEISGDFIAHYHYDLTPGTGPVQPTGTEHNSSTR
ncbi:sulfotransferase family protein [Tautonia marina]|uniref:sulfotransferase family protein n=1 Tax=Tautonia marina TaxID=2653855 RepID=UPI0012613890|nr:sulfotransferase [Tautonia marina]